MSSISNTTQIATDASSMPSTSVSSSTSGSGSTVTDHTASFSTDPRIAFNKVTGKWEFEDDDGNEMEWDMAKNGWVPVIDEELVKQQQAVYKVEGVDEDTPAAPVQARTKKRKVVDYTSNTASPSDSQPPPKKRGKKSDAASSTTATKPQVSKNTAVFVTHLALDATPEEIAARFSKCGVLMEDDDGQPKVKMYADEHGNFNGDALVVYFMEDSVRLAESILDEAELRLGDPTTRMRVRQGEFGHKQGEGEGREVKRRVVDKKKVTQRIVKMKNKVGDWNFEDGFGPAEDPVEEKRPLVSRVAVLKYMFTQQELKDDPSLLLELKEDVRDEAENLGDVTNVVLYDLEPEGVMTVKFRDPISAQACVLKMNGRFFARRKIEAYLFDGKERFKKSGSGQAHEDGEEAAETERLADFEKWLMAEGESN